MSDYIKIVEWVAENEPSYAGECGGDIYCFYCGAWLPYEKHENDCIYELALKLVLKREMAGSGA